MSAAIPDPHAETASPHGEQTVTEWALTAIALHEQADLPAPPFHDRLTHLAQALGLGPDGYRFVALFFGLWRSSDLHGPLTMAQARTVLGNPPAELRNTALWWEILNETPIAPGTPVALSLDETIGDWLEGGDPIPPRWRDRISVLDAPKPLPHWPMDALVTRAAQALEDGAPLVITCAGPSGSGRRSLAAGVCAALGTSSFGVDLQGLDDSDALALMRIAERAALLGMRPAVYSGGAALTVPSGQPGFPLRFVIANAAGEGLRLPGATQHRTTLGAVPMCARAEIWAQLCPGFTEWSTEEQQWLCALKPATIGDISAVSTTAPDTAQAAMVALRQRQIARLDHRIQPVQGNLSWPDLVVPKRLERGLHRLRTEMAGTAALWNDPTTARLYSRGRGVFALFSGPPGTGKTMAAQVIASELGVDLYVVDAGAVVSKYVGETAHNLQALFAQAERDAAVLFFDEADGLFGKRTEVNDAHARYLNADTNVLLRAVEEFGGNCILATNRRDNIDPAFLRRLRAVMDFPRPDAALRLRLWEGLACALGAEDDTLQETCQRLAEGLDFTGAQIKNALRTALLEAREDGGRSITSADLLEGADHELLKEGRALTLAEAARLRGETP